MKIKIELMSQETGIPHERIRVALGVPATFSEAKAVEDHQRFSNKEPNFAVFQMLIAKCACFLEAIEAYKIVQDDSSLRHDEKWKNKREKLLKKAIQKIDEFGPTHLEITETLENVIAIFKQCPGDSKTREMAAEKEGYIVRELTERISNIKEAKVLFRRASKRHQCLYQKWFSMIRTAADAIDMYRTIKKDGWVPREIEEAARKKLYWVIENKIDKARTIEDVKTAIEDTDFELGWTYRDMGLRKWNQMTIAAAAKAKTVKQAVKVFEKSNYRFPRGIREASTGYVVAEKRIGELFAAQVTQIKSITKIKKFFAQARELPRPSWKYWPVTDVVRRWLMLAKTKEQIVEIYMSLEKEDCYDKLADQVLVRLAEYYKGESKK